MKSEMSTVGFQCDFLIQKYACAASSAPKISERLFISFTLFMSVRGNAAIHSPHRQLQTTQGIILYER